MNRLMVALKSCFYAHAMRFGLAMILCAPLPAALIQTGNVEPRIYSWDSSVVGYVGRTDDGSVLINLSITLTSHSGYLGYGYDTTGMATVTGTRSRWINSQDLYVGNFGHGTLAIEAGGQVSNSLGHIGYGPDSQSMATVTGTGSSWTNSGALSIGYQGSGVLNISAGGQVSNATAYLARTRGSSGTVTVRGANSKWLNSGLIVGDRGDGNLAIEAGGQVNSSDSWVGRLFSSTGTVKVIGGGSQWVNSGFLNIGGSGNGSLTIQAGGVVSNTGSSIGGNSEATVIGSGSQWINAGSLRIDSQGTLTVADGGKVVAGELYASKNDLFGDGTITISNGGIIDADLVFDAAKGNQATIGFGSGGTLLFTAAGPVLGAGYKDDGTLTIADGVSISSDKGYLGYNSSSTGTATISGPGSQWLNSGELYIGSSGSGNLTIEAGGQVSNTVGYLGNSAGSTSTALITGESSKWTNGGSLFVGDRGTGTLTVSNDGEAIIGDSLYLGSGGTLTVSNGGEVVTGDLYASIDDLIGNGRITATRGAVLDVDLLSDATHQVQEDFAFGTGGTLSVNWNGGTLGVGHKKSGSLKVAEGSSVTSNRGLLGYQSGSTGTVIVTGIDSKWTIDGSLVVGNLGTGMLTIEAGGQVSSDVGSIAGSSSKAIVTGLDSQWAINGALRVSGNLAIEAGGQVVSNVGSVANSSGLGATVLVTGEGSRWVNTGELNIGNRGDGTLTVADGGEVITGELITSLGDLLGNGTITAANGAILDANLRFDATNGTQANVPFGSGGTLIVCAEGGVLGVGSKHTSSLTITGGVKIASSAGYLGYQQNLTGIAEIWGEGSSWNIDGDLMVGDGGRGILLITGGGLVSVGGTLRINDGFQNNSFINMASTSMLALRGDSDDTLAQFLEMINGEDIRFWNATLGSWAPLITATYGSDYTLEYLTTGDLAGYTLLTVGTAIPEPATWLPMISLATLACVVRHCPKRKPN